MNIVDVIQGSDQWLEVRAKHFCASEASAMMGDSKYMTRDELLQQKVTGIVPEIDEHTQKLFDKGHAAEASIRPHIEKIIGQELFPATGVDHEMVEGLRLLASFDGITMDENIVFEHKLWNEELANQVRLGNLDPHYVWQLEQQLMLSGAEKAIFVTSDGTPEKMAYCWYESSLDKVAQLIKGWIQFQEDLENYQHKEQEYIPVAQAIKALPALNIQLVGEVKNSNLVAYRETALSFIRRINTDLKTDQDFADAEAMVKFCDKAEKDMEAAKKMALAQTASIDELFRTIDVIKDEMRTKRLELNKLVDARKKAIRFEIQNTAAKAITDHIVKLNERLGQPFIASIKTDFAGAMKNKRTITSLQSAVNDELARAKIEANEIADRIDINLKSLREHAEGYAFLFADLQHIINKENDDFIAIIESRIAKHEKAEEERLEKIRQEERERAEAEAKKKAEEEAAAKAREEAAQKKPEPEPAQTSEPDIKEPTIQSVIPARRNRPSDKEIIDLLTTHFGATESEVMSWLMDMNLRKAS